MRPMGVWCARRIQSPNVALDKYQKSGRFRRILPIAGHAETASRPIGGATPPQIAPSKPRLSDVLKRCVNRRVQLRQFLVYEV